MTLIENRAVVSCFAGHAATKRLNVGQVLATKKPTINAYTEA